ncbi:MULTISPECIES: TetR/AcrR family transcriptional regulator [unclassified Streptomyces]|uniref:TetR/AcrR family transcriptional regulator n=1 Tax=unclassified Streptomyces TaxID=2593676 RepID=UPI0033B51493
MASEKQGTPVGLRSVTRRAVRAEISAKALQLFLTQGFEETTVSQIAAAVGTSTRNVFRYFASKEDILISDLLELGDQVATSLADRPADEDAWTALRRALQVCVDSLEKDVNGVQKAQMLASSPSLRTALRDKQMRWTQLLVPYVTARLESSAEMRELQAQALVSSALSCLDAAAMSWISQEGKSLDDYVDVAFAAIRD